MRLNSFSLALVGIALVGGALYKNKTRSLSDEEVLEQVSRAIAKNTEDNFDAPPAKVDEREAAPNAEALKTDSELEAEQQKQFAQEQQEAIERLQVKENKVATQKTSTARDNTPEVKEEAKEIKAPKLSPTSNSASKDELLVTLKQIRADFEKTTDFAQKSELEVKAVELCAAYFALQRKILSDHFGVDRNIASKTPEDMDPKLLAKLVALNNRERATRTRISTFLKGSLPSPL